MHNGFKQYFFKKLKLLIQKVVCWMLDLGALVSPVHSQEQVTIVTVVVDLRAEDLGV